MRMLRYYLITGVVAFKIFLGEAKRMQKKHQWLPKFRLNKTIIPLASVGYEMITTCYALCAFLVTSYFSWATILDILNEPLRQPLPAANPKSKMEKWHLFPFAQLHHWFWWVRRGVSVPFYSVRDFSHNVLADVTKILLTQIPVLQLAVTWDLPAWDS